MKGKLKRLLALTLALTMSAAIAGCGDKNSSDSSSTADSSSAAEEEEKKEKEPVVETIGDFDLSDFTSEYDVPADFSFESEGEAGELSGEAFVMDSAFAGDFTGDGFVAIPSNGDEVTFEVELPALGSYDIVMQLASESLNSVNQITVDGATAAKFTASDKQFLEVTAANVLIEGGKHTIGVRAESGNIYLDSLKIVPAAGVDLSQFEVTKELCNPNASENARRLYSFLRATYGKYTISGQYIDAQLNKAKLDVTDLHELKEIKKNTDKSFALLGLDVMNLGISTMVDHQAGGGETVLFQAKDWYNNQNGIVTLCWHWHAPSQYLEANDQPWWRGFYTDSVSFNLGKAMSGEDKEGYDAIVAELDNMAEQLKTLADEDIPILWRPLHEAAGDPRYPGNAWFWWGSSGKEAYLELYKLMYDKFVNEYHLDNLIWVWNAQNPDWYPGDEYVDIVGFDIYPAEQDSSSQKDYFDFLAECSPTRSKIIAETENGSMFDPELAFNEGARWSFFATWGGEFTIGKDLRLSGQYTTLDMWNKIYNSDRVLTLDELPNLKSWPIDLEEYLANN